MAIKNTTRQSYISVTDGVETYPINKDYVVNGTSELSNPYEILIFYDKSDKIIKATDSKLLVA